MLKMVAYCKQDVRLLEKVFKHVQGVSSAMPNMNLFSSRPVCPKCGEDRLAKDRKRVYRSKIVQTYLCRACGGYAQDNKDLRKGSL
jgi:predicted RNA-binding Zn-ribbon protein involved in translation (DUF1610 family)